MFISGDITGLKRSEFWEPWLQPGSPCLWETTSIILQLGFLSLLLIAFLKRLIESRCIHEPKVVKTREPYNPTNTNIGLPYKLSLATSVLLLGTHITIPLMLKTRSQAHCKLETPILSSEIMEIVSWAVTLVALYAIPKRQNVDFPWILRSWWLCTFLLTVFRLTLDVRFLVSHHHRPELLEYIDFFALLPSTCLLFLAIRGKTGITVANPSGLTEPFLDRNPKKHDSEEEKRECPYGKASIFQLVTFSWLNPLFVIGIKKPLDQDEVPDVDRTDSAGFTSEFFDECLNRNRESTENNPNIYKVIYLFTRKKLAINALFAVTNAAASYVGPYLINDLVSFLNEKGAQSLTNGYVIAIGFLGAKVIETLTQRQWIFGARQLGLRLRAALISHIYKKGLVLSSRSCQSHTSGEIINIMSVDIQRITDFMWYVNTIFMLPIQISLAIFVLHVNLGLGSLVGLAATIVVMSGNIPLTRVQKWYQSKIMESKDARMKSTSEILKNIKTLKLQAWDTHYLRKLESFRKVEYDWIWKSLKLNALAAFVFWGAPTFISVMTFGGCVLMGIPLTAGRVLSALATFRMLQDPIFNLPDLLNVIAQGKVSADRVASYLREEEIASDTVEFVPRNRTEIDVEIKSGKFSWDPDSRIVNLDGIDLEVKRGMKVAICGTVGSGKSSLLSCILGEMPKLSGTVKISGTKAYVPQSAWILTGNVRENILFGNDYDRTRYEDTVKACALTKDFELFSAGDLTEIGERGINMSGGQKQRIQIARAVYDDADIYLLDDPFSAVDAHTGTELFQECLLGMLKEKTVLYVTHQVEFLPAADLILVMQNGRIAQMGTFKELLKQNIGFEVLVGAHNQALESVLAVETSSRELEQAPVVDEEPTLITELSQTKQDSEHNLCVDMSKQEGKLVHEEEREKGSIGKEVYWSYLTLAKGGILVPIILVAQSSFQVLQIASNYWMAWACPTDSTEIVTGMGFILLVYTLLAVGSSLCVLLRASLVAIAGLLTSEKLFNDMLHSVLRAPMAFFDSTPAGRILNRASTDQSVIDLEMANRIGWCAFSTIQLLGTMAVMSQVAWEVFAILIPVTAICVWYQRYYIPTARELARLAGIERAPILHHFAESLTGAATIRAFQQQDRFIEKNLCLIDNHSRPWFHNVAAIEWLCFRLNQLSNFVFAFSLVLLVTLPEGIIDPSIAGLAVTYGINLNVQQASVIWNICNAENKMISVERVLQYSKLTSEAPLVIEEARPPTEWPQNGTISFTNLQITLSIMAAEIKGLHRSARVQNMEELNSINWYQSPRLGGSLGTTADCESETSEIEGKRGCDVRNSEQHKRKIWHLRRREVLKRLDRLNLRETDFPVSKPHPSLFLSRKLKKARCYLCLSRGHMYWNCPNMNRRMFFKGRCSQELGGGPKSKKSVTKPLYDRLVIPTPNWTVVGTDGQGWNNIWYVSDEYPRHMTSNEDLFKHLKKGSIGTSRVGIKVAGFGEIVVSTETRKYLIAGVYLVPNCALNVLSLQQLIVQGFRVRIQETKAILERAFEEEYVREEEGVNVLGAMCKNEDLHKLDCIQEKAINEVFKFYNSCEELQEEKTQDGKKVGKVPTKSEFDSLIGFMKMVSEEEIKEECKSLVEKHFEKMVKWFYGVYLEDEERSTPVEIYGVEICLLDVYLSVQEQGGHVFVTTKDGWEEVARALGFPSEFADGIKRVYETHLGLLEAYYDIARRHSKDELAQIVGVSKCAAPEADEDAGAEMSVATGLPRSEDIPGGNTDTSVEELEEHDDDSEKGPVKHVDSSKEEDDDFIIID